MRFRAAVAGLVVAAVAAVCAPPAAADVISITPANESGEPVEQFHDQEGIWAYVNAGFAGGMVCVVKAVPGPAATPTCQEPAMGRPRVVGFSQFQLVPIVAPLLEPGDYWIVGDNGDESTVVSTTITVTKCDDCPPEFLQDAVAGFKDGMRVIADTLNVTCALLSLYESASTTVAAGQMGMAIGATAVAAGRIGATLPVGQVAYLDLAVAQQTRQIVGAFVTKTIFSKEAVAKMILQAGVCINGAISQRIADDPPDPDFETVTPPPVLGLPEIEDQPQADALVRTSEAAYGHAAALLHAYERFQGAEQAGSEQFMRVQAGAVADQGDALVESLQAQVGDLRAFASAMETLGDERFTAPSVTTQENLDKIKAARDAIRVDGFTADEIQAMRDDGLTDAQIAIVREELGSDVSAVPLDTSSVEGMRAAAGAIEERLEDVERFARTARVVEQRLTPDPGGNEPPVANAGPDLEITEGGAAALDASGSSDPDGEIERYTWDFGDGSPAETVTGPGTSHPYAASGTYTAQLTVTDDDGATATDTATVTVANGSPSLYVPPFPRAPVGVARPYKVYVSTGQGEPTTVVADFGDGTAPAELQTTATGYVDFTHAYAAPGDYALSFTATDDEGASHTLPGSVKVADAVADAGPDRTGLEGDSVALGGASTPPDENTTVTWDFGDGTPEASGPAQDHVYRDDGLFVATVKVTDSKGTVTDTVAVAVGNVAPVADIAAPVMAQPGESLTLRGMAADPGADEHRFAWDFGDGGTGTGRKVQHAFAAPGTYTVGVEAADGDGGSDEAQAQVVVGAPAGMRDSRGRDFWIAFPKNHSNRPDLTLFVAGETATSGRVQVPGMEVGKPFTVTPGEVTAVTVPGAAELAQTGSAQDRGVHVTAGADVSVYGLSRYQYTTDAFLGLPVDALGKDYRLASYSPLGSPEAAVVATREDTTVTITPAEAIDGDHPAGVPFTVALDLGEAYQLTSSSDLTGTRITADKPVAAFGAHECANIPVGVAACDHLVEQLPSVDTWGRRFVTVPLATRIGGDTFRIVAAQDGTTVRVGGAAVAELDAGGFHERVIDGSSVIEADKPVLLLQYSNGSGFDGVTSDPFMVVVPPYEQFQSAYTVTTPDAGFAGNFINLAVPAWAADSVRIDGAAPASAAFKAIGTSGFKGAQIPVELGSHRIEAAAPIGVTVYGFDAFDSYGYGGGLALAGVATVQQLALTPASEDVPIGATACVDAKLTAAGGSPVPDVRVDFSVTGAHPGGDPKTTGADGVARFCYAGKRAGDDTVTAAVGALARTAVKRWREPAAPVVTPTPTPTPKPEPEGDVKGEQSGAADLVLACTERLVVLEDVVPAGNRVKLVGVADRRFAGQPVSLVFAPTGKAVARATVAPDGSFAATAPLPPRKLRTSNAARYEARVGGERSLALKLARRMRISSITASGGKVTIAGTVSGPLAARQKDRAVELQRRIGCTKTVFVARTMPKRDGSFRLTVKAPAGETAAVYRLRTKVRPNATSRKALNTFTLPRAIDF